MFHLLCNVFRDPDESDEVSPALVTVISVAHDELMPLMIITCSDGTWLLKRMSQEVYSVLMQGYRSDFPSWVSGCGDLTGVGGFVRVSHNLESYITSSLNDAGLQRTAITVEDLYKAQQAVGQWSTSVREYAADPEASDGASVKGALLGRLNLGGRK